MYVEIITGEMSFDCPECGMFWMQHTVDSEN